MRCRHLIPIFAMGLVLGIALPVRAAGGAASSPAAGPWTAEHDASPAFTPDGDTVVFARGRGVARRLYVAHRRNGTWSAPERAPFSDQWMDMEPAMAPDGSCLVFVSNRPANGDGKALDGNWGGKPQPGRGGNLWRVVRTGTGWGAPRRLPDAVNASASTFSPALARDGSLYFVRVEPANGAFRLYRSSYVHGSYQMPQPLALGGGASSDYDPAVAPDQSFLVFSSDRAPASPNGGDLFIAFAAAQGGWTMPLDLGVAGDEARLGADRDALYFSASDHRIHRLLLAAWLARRPAR